MNRTLKFALLFWLGAMLLIGFGIYVVCGV